MDFAWTADQQRYLDSVRVFAEAQLRDDVVSRDAAGTFWHEGWRRCADFGLLALPAELLARDDGPDPLTIIGTLEALGYSCRDNGLLFAINAHLWGCQMPLLRFGTEIQRKRYLQDLFDGTSIGALAMTESESGSDAYNVSTTAVPHGDGFVLNGVKSFVTNAPVAGLFIVIARTGRTGALGSLSAFIVDRQTPGLLVGPPAQKMGLRTAAMADVEFSDCRIPEQARLGAAGLGMSVFNLAMTWERSCILASSVGTMQHLLERCTAFARDHKRFGKPIGSFQAVSHKLAEMKLRLETSRLLLYRLGWLHSTGRQPPAESALVKLHISESLVLSCMDAVQIHGGAGYLADTELERQVRDALASRIYSGTSEIQRDIVARGLGL